MESWVCWEGERVWMAVELGFWIRWDGVCGRFFSFLFL